MSSLRSDSFLAAAFWAGFVACVLVLVMAALILLLRFSSRQNKARWNSVVREWRPALLATVLSDTPFADLPPLAWRDRRHFLQLWLYLHESLRGTGPERLNAAAFALNVPTLASRMLARDRGAARLLAVAALGRLQHRPSSGRLLRIAGCRDPLLSSQAARALAHIDPVDAAHHLMPLLLSRSDWEIARIADALASARQTCRLLLTHALPAAPPGNMVRGLRLALALRLDLPISVLQGLLAQGQPTALLCTALPLVAHAELAPLVRGLLTHQAWQVRAEAVLALGRVASGGDLRLLVQAIEDAQFEVRMAAARVLAGLPFLTAEEMLALRNAQTSGGCVMRHVLAERALA